jgi:DNA-binding CsgD family transcriptional regulator/tetratricopeptide (TPR) repeat protein
MLVERQEALEQLNGALERAIRDGGQTVLLCGEAGIGKTALIDVFADALSASTAVYWGGCEALFAARPLGPLFDIAEQLGGEFAKLLRSGADNHKIYSAFLALINDPKFAGAVFIFEDVHWADNATMDFLKFTGRRISKSHCLLIASYREDEVGANHPLRQVLGDLPGNSTGRIRLQTLSQNAIAELGGCDKSRAKEIHAVTDGNPFFVRELLSSREAGIPATVSDAILAKAASLSPDARLLLNLVAVVPGKCEIQFLEDAFENSLDLLDECAEHGLLSIDRNFAAFNHELARLAVEDAIPAGQRSKWHAHMLGVLRLKRPEASARLAHHADMSGAQDAVLEYAPPAAAEAARLGAHREAVALYRQALNNADTLADRERADLLEHLAYEFYVTGKIEDAIDTRRQCLELWQTLANELKVAKTHRWLSRLHWFIGQRSEAEKYAEEALNLSEESRRSSEYAMACSNRAQLYMLSGEVMSAAEWAGKAIALAEANGDTETLVHALNNLGSALGIRSTQEGMPHLVRSLELSLEHNFQEHVARAYTNIASILVSAKRYRQAAEFLDAGIDYSAERDLDSWLYYMQGWRAQQRLETGDWVGAEDDALAVTRGYRGAALVASPAMSALARLRLRRGDPDSQAAIDAAIAIIADTKELQRFAPLVATSAERAWLLGEAFDDADSLIATRDWAVRLEQSWYVGELSGWARKLGAVEEAEGELPEPYELLLRHGDWAGAARAWERIGCPYEAALALAEGDEGAQKEALEIFTKLGAEPAAARLRKDLRARGVKDLPKVARQSTKSNPAGLTNRQLVVLEALSDGLSDAEIAARLFISPRTVSHHVSAILGKLDVQSRTEAAMAARKLGIGQ